MNWLFVPLLVLIVFRMILVEIRANRAESRVRKYQDIADRALKAGKTAQDTSNETLEEMRAMQKRNLSLQDELILFKNRYSELIQGKTADMLLGSPLSWVGGMQEGKEIHLTIRAPKITSK